MSSTVVQCYSTVVWCCDIVLHVVLCYVICCGVVVQWYVIVVWCCMSSWCCGTMVYCGEVL